MHLELFYTNLIMYFYSNCSCPFKWLHNTLSVYNSGLANVSQLSDILSLFLFGGFFFPLCNVSACFHSRSTISSSKGTEYTFLVLATCCLCFPKEVNEYLIFS